MKRSIVVGDDRRRAGGECLEEVAVRHGAESLVPRVVARGEMRGDVVARRELALQALRQHPPYQLRVLPAHLVEGLGQQGVEPLGGGPGLLGGEHLAQQRHDRALLGQRGDVASGSAAA